MMQSYLFLTQTVVNQNMLHALVCANYFQPETFPFGLFQPTTVHFDPLQTEKAQQLLHHLESQKQILIPDLSAKKDFREYSVNLYQNFPQPTLLFLGNISDYSISVQEGMLKLLEEPPHNVIIILYAQNRTDILPTIASRVTIHVLSEEIIRAVLDTTFIEKIKKTFPPIAQTAAELVQSPETIVLDDIFKNLAKTERSELDFWLWQLSYYLIQMYKKQPHDHIAAVLTKVNSARQLNQGNVQKKFAVLKAIV